MKTTVETFVEDPERRRIYEQESLAFEATELISELMAKQDISKTELARRVGKSKAYITQLLSGSRNMTFHTFADLAYALGRRIELGSAPLDGELGGMCIGGTDWMPDAVSAPYKVVCKSARKPNAEQRASDDETYVAA